MEPQYGTAVLFYTLLYMLYLAVKKPPYSGSLRME